jgi:hypothetical protein
MFPGYVQKIGFLDTFSQHVRFANICSANQHALIWDQLTQPLQSESLCLRRSPKHRFSFELSFRRQKWKIVVRLIRVKRHQAVSVTASPIPPRDPESVPSSPAGSSFFCLVLGERKLGVADSVNNAIMPPSCQSSEIRCSQPSRRQPANATVDSAFLVCPRVVD